MWILFKKTYSGPLGVFEAGSKKDLPKDTVKKLPRRFYIKTCAPWDEYKDKDTAEMTRLGSELQRATQTAKNMRQCQLDCKTQIEQLKAKDIACDETAQEAEKLAEQLQKKLNKLAAEIEDKKAAEREKAEAAEAEAAEKAAAESAEQKVKAEAEKADEAAAKKEELNKQAKANEQAATEQIMGSLGLNQKPDTGEQKTDDGKTEAQKTERAEQESKSD